MSLVIAGCSRTDDETQSTLTPVASTVDPNQPNVIVDSDRSGSDMPDFTLSNSDSTNSDGQDLVDYEDAIDDLPIEPAATTPLDAASVDDLLSGTDATNAPTTTKPADPATQATTTTTPSVTSPETTTPKTTTQDTVTTSGPNPDDDTDGPPRDAVQLAALPRPVTATDNSGSPKVVRYTPDGEVGLAPYVAVTFDQPMDQGEVPITIDPPQAGSWRWVGTRTVRFEVDDDSGRLPAATRFAVTVDRSMKSASGARLAGSVKWSFSTTPPRVVDVFGATADVDQAPVVDTEPIFVVQFNQRVTPVLIAAVSKLVVGDESFDVRVATTSELEASPDAVDALRAPGAGLAVALTPESELPTDQPVELIVGPDITSAEGSLTQSDSYSFFARTHGFLELVESACSDANRCAAGSGLRLLFNNNLDVGDLSNSEIAKMVTVEPTLPSMSITVSGAAIAITGETAHNTTYTVTVATGLTDVFGQSLQEPIEATFKIGDALTSFDGPRSEMVVLDPESKTPALAVNSVNHQQLRVMVWAVTMTDFADYLSLNDAIDEGVDPEPPERWAMLSNEVIDVADRPNEVVTTKVDLDEEFSQAGSQLVVYVRPEQPIAPDDERFVRNVPVLSWVQYTRLAVDAVADESNLLIWTTDLLTGKPIGDVPVDLIGDGRVATTDDEGLAVVKLGDTPLNGMVANNGSQLAFLPSPGGRGWTKTEGLSAGRWTIVDDRGVYRPGDEVRLTGWLRNLDPSSDQLLKTPDEGTDLTYSVTDAAGNKVAAGDAVTNKLGGFTLEFGLVATAAEGPATVTLTAGTRSTTHDITIKKYETPDFDVTVRPTGLAPHVATTPLRLTANATYSTGTPVARATTRWTVTTTRSDFTPPNHPEFSFGYAADGYGTVTNPDESECKDCSEATVTKEFDGVTDGTGTDAVSVDLSNSSGFPTIVSANATVTNANRNTWSGSTAQLVHPARNYVGLKTESLFVNEGDDLIVDGIVTDLTGNLVAGRPVEVTINTVKRTWSNGEWTEQLIEADTCSFESVANPSPGESGVCQSRLAPGEYRIVASVTDADGGVSRTELNRWVSGSLARTTPGVQLESARIIPDKASYEPGDTARLLISAPWAPAHGVVTISRYNIEAEIPFEAEEGFAVVEVPITERAVPNVTGWVTMAGAAPRLAADGQPIEGATRPAVASAKISLPVSAKQQTLEVKVTPSAKTVRPGDSASLAVTVTDADGEPVSDAQVVVAVADEAAAATADYRLADPEDVFYADYYGNLQGSSVRQYVQLIDSAEIVRGPDPSAPFTAEESTDQGDEPESATPNSRPVSLALYSTDNFTDDDGNATVTFEVPTALTQYRIMAIAVGDTQRFGAGESQLTAGRPLEIRPMAPAALGLDDELSLPVVVANRSDRDQQVDIAIDAADLRISGTSGQTVAVPANSQVQVHFEVTARLPGRLAYRIVAQTQGDAQTTDSVTSTIIVGPPNTTQTSVGTGVLNLTDDRSAVAQPLTIPSSIRDGYGGADVRLSTSILSTLADPIDALSNSMLDSTSASATQVIALADVQNQLDVIGTADGSEGTDGTDPRLGRARVSLNRLIENQLDDGGWAAWPRQTESDPWATALATHAIIAGGEAKWAAIPEETLTAALTYVNQIDQHLPTSYDPASAQVSRAYAIKVQRLAGGSHTESAGRAATALWTDAGAELPADALAMILPSIGDPETASEVVAAIQSRMTDTAAGTRFQVDVPTKTNPINQSAQRAQALVVDGLLESSQPIEVVDPAIGVLLADRTDGTWTNDQANAFAVAAIGRYHDRFEQAQPNIGVRAWLAESLIIDERLDSDRDSVAALADTTQLRRATSDSAATVTVAGTGNGRLYYRIGLAYAVNGEQPAVDNGFVVERSFEPIDKPSDVTREADGTWVIASGAPVRVRLTMITDADRTDVALIDPLPTGFEPVRPSLSVAVRPDESDRDPSSDPSLSDRWSGWSWFEHQQLNGTRAEAVTSKLASGMYEYAYVARATTPGEYSVSAATARAIYHTDVWGASPTDRVVIRTG